jgi:hypothetical protein
MKRNGPWWTPSNIEWKITAIQWTKRPIGALVATSSLWSIDYIWLMNLIQRIPIQGHILSVGGDGLRIAILF